MPIAVVGINHIKSTIDVREKFYLQPTERELLLSELKNDPQVVGAFVLSTCNRTEIYADLISENPDILLDTILRIKKISPNNELRNHFYAHTNDRAVRHLLNVTTGLNSLILGEKQILGQIKEAIAFSAQRKMLSKDFNILANIVIEAGKKARRETGIDGGGSSVSWAAVAAAQQHFGSLEGKSVLILGSGKMGQLAIEQISKKGVDNIFIMNRTLEKAQAIAQSHGAKAVPFWELKEILTQVDVCICSASCVHYLINEELIQWVMVQKEEKQLLCIDISMPRNIDPAVSGVEGVSLISVDDLDKVVQANTQRRLEAVKFVEEIIESKLKEFYNILYKRSLFSKCNTFERVNL